MMNQLDDPSRINKARILKGMGFESPEDFAGLQAADLLANRWYNTLTYGRHDSAGQVFLKPEHFGVMRLLTQKEQVGIGVCDASSMDRIIAMGNLSEEALEQMRSIDGPVEVIS